MNGICHAYTPHIIQDCNNNPRGQFTFRQNMVRLLSGQSKPRISRQAASLLDGLLEDGVENYQAKIDKQLRCVLFLSKGTGTVRYA